MASFFVKIKPHFCHCNQSAVSLQDSVAFCLHLTCLSSIDCSEVKFSAQPLLSPLTACWETIQQHAADWSDLKCTSRTPQCILMLFGIFVTCAHLKHLPHLFHVAFICKSLPFPLLILTLNRWPCIFPPLEILQQSEIPTLPYICAQIYMHAFHSFSFTMDELFLSIQYIFKGGIILVSGHLQLCLFLLTCQLLSHFIQILAFLIKKENNLLIPCLCSIP